MLGNRLRQLRKERNITQVQLAEKLHVSKGTVAMWEVDKRMPSVEMCSQIADCFGISISELLSKDEQNCSTTFFASQFLSFLRKREIRESLKIIILQIEMEEERNGN